MHMPIRRSSPFIENYIYNIIKHLTNILQNKDKIIILDYILYQKKISLNKYH
jgi:hypothetical protein